MILRGHVSMASLAGDQWNEGDVSCSVRRAVLPDSFFAADGLLETTLTVLGQLGFSGNFDQRKPPLFSISFNNHNDDGSRKNGCGREAAHAAIKEHAVPP